MHLKFLIIQLKASISVECNKLSKLLNGGLLVTLEIDKNAKVLMKSKNQLRKHLPYYLLSNLLRSIAICGECGFKDEPFEDKCPKCKSPYIV